MATMLSCFSQPLLALPTSQNTATALPGTSICPPRAALTFKCGSVDAFACGLWLVRESAVLSHCRSRRTSTRAAVTLSLPNAKWSARAIKAFSMAELEARKLKYPTTGTEALLMGMLTEGTSMGARFLRSKGVKLMDVREETVKLLGKADMYYFSPEHPPLTPPAEAAIAWAIQAHQREGGKGEVSTELLLLGIWEQREEGAGHRILASLGITDADIEQLRDLEKQLVPA